MELRAMHRELADRPVEIDVGNPPAALILAQKVVEPRHIALRFDDPSFHYNICAERPFTGDLQLLARISVELIGVGGGHIMTKGRDQLLLLGGVRLAQEGPIARRVLGLVAATAALWVRGRQRADHRFFAGLISIAVTLSCFRSSPGPRPRSHPCPLSGFLSARSLFSSRSDCINSYRSRRPANALLSRA